MEKGILIEISRAEKDGNDRNGGGKRIGKTFPLFIHEEDYNSKSEQELGYLIKFGVKALDKYK